MRIPVPTNRLVALTLVGGLLTMLVATGLAVPGLGVSPDTADSGGDNSSAPQAADAPEPNQEFSPAVQTQSEYEDEHEEYEEYEDEEYEDDDEDDEYED